MTKALKKLLIECHPDKHGGDHSRMEKFFEEVRKSKVSQSKHNKKYCKVCGARIGIKAKNCMIHRNTVSLINN